MIFPSPELTKEWKDWARALIKVLSSSQQQQTTSVHSYTVATVPAPQQDGQIVQISDETGGCTLATSLAGVWLRVSDGAPIG